MKKIDKIILYFSFIIVFFILLVYIFNLNINFISSGEQVAKILEIKKETPKEIVLLGRSELLFTGSSEARIENINIAVSKINNTVIKNREEFSFNKTLGEVSENLGYKEARSFLNGEVVLGIGGGVCHVSTALFESILNTGLPVTERHNHTFAVSFYKIGLDATVSSLGPDLKFVNDTGYDISILGRVENDKVIFEIYGVKDNRIVYISEAKITNRTNKPLIKYIETNDMNKDGICENTPQIGYTTEVDYNISYSNSETKNQIFKSIYKPLARSCYIYTDPITGCSSQTIYSPTTGIKCE